MVRAAEREWRATPEPSREDGGGANAAGNNLPAYYLYAAAPYLLASGGDVIDRLYADAALLRAAAVAFAVSAWLLAGEVLGRDRPAQLVAAAIAGLAPMATFVGTAVTPDAMLLPLWGLWFWLAAQDAEGACTGATRLSWRGSPCWRCASSPRPSP